jgi:hypothetical protein
MGHTCHANFCRVSCKPEHLMCPHHWAMVPLHTKDRVLHAYRPGQCDDMRPSPEWLEAAFLAVAQVAAREHAPMSKRQRALLEGATPCP